MTHFTVVVVTHDSAEVLGPCLASLEPAIAGAATAEVVVVDNASSDSTLDVARSSPIPVRPLALPHNRGYAAAINAALGGTDDPGDAVLVLNPDVRLAPGSVAAMLEVLEDPSIGVVVPRLLSPDGEVSESLRRRPTALRALGGAVLGTRRAGRVPLLGEVVTDPAAYAAPGDVDWAAGAVMLIARRCIDAVGLWDESYFLYSEEVDFALRAIDVGFRIRYEPRASAVHLGGSSVTDPRLWSLLTRNRVRLQRQRLGWTRAALFGVGVALNELARLGRGPTHRAALAALCGSRARALAGLGDKPSGVICFSAQDWWYFNRAHSDFQLLTRVARSRPVLLVNSLGMRMPAPGRTARPWSRVARKVRSMARGYRRPIPGLPGFAVFTPIFPPVYGPGRLRAASDRFVAWQVRRVAARHGVFDPAMVVTIPTALGVASRIPHRVMVANRSDRYSSFTEADQGWVAGLERDLLADADIAVYASSALMAAESHLTANPVFLDHGVDLARFSDPGSEPPDLAAVGRPRVGFFGAIDDYTVDCQLLERLACELPHAELVLVGPSDCNLQALTRLPNVHWLGPKPAEEIPAYGRTFDVAIMPWLDNEWIHHCNPIKLKEYLALGLPVVTTYFPEAERYRPVIAIASDAEEFVSLVGEALAGQGVATPDERRASVAGDSWHRRAAELLDLCDRAWESKRDVPVCVAS